MKFRYKILIYLFAFLFPWVIEAQTRGIDVSKYQGTINWKKVAQSKKVKYVYVKATEGTTIQDPYYKKNIDGARAEGLLVGSYHLYSSKTSAYQQFDNFKRTVDSQKQDLIPVLDVEERHSRNLYVARVDKLLELMEAEYGVKPIIYTSERVYVTHFSGKKYKDYQIFVANYRRYPRTRFTMWQYTQTGRVNGIKGDVDFSEIHQDKSLSNIKLPEKKKK